ncbi:MAG: hydrogenase formation protein HypD [Candidatus Azobacteroides sp.]|nr:hydrogenase formation protein HypD [Candidatus Azobacteroides sp.]
MELKYTEDFRNNDRVRTLVNAIHKETVHAWKIMEICGGQTHAIARFGIEEMLPSEIKLLHGPGCPVCVTPIRIIDHVLEIAKRPEVIFTSFGDMMRVPGSESDLLKTKAAGADIRILYSPSDAIAIASENPEKEIVFFAVGFETTAPVYLATLKEAKRRNLKNFSLLTSLFTVPPAIDMILRQPDHQVSGFLTAGHVCAVTGCGAYRTLAAEYNRPMVVTGFEPTDLLYGIYKCVCQLERGIAQVENAYKRVVSDTGNPEAIQLMEEMTVPVDMEWRGIGVIPASGLSLNKRHEEFDAGKKFPSKHIPKTASATDVCIAGDIMKGNKQPSDCVYFGTTCNPEHPSGAPMVSSEGVCSAYFKKMIIA